MNSSLIDLGFGLSQKKIHPRVAQALAVRLTVVSPPLNISDQDQPKQGFIKRRVVKCE